MTNKFKAGDKVYFPKVSIKVYTLSKNKNNNSSYPLQITYMDDTFDIFTSEGLLNKEDINPSLFLATKENQSLLNQLYGIKFDEPISKKDIVVKNIKEKGYCLCLVSDEPITKTEHLVELNEVMEVITQYDEELAYPYISSLESAWFYVEPIKINSDGIITYLADI